MNIINFYELPSVQKFADKNHNPNYDKHKIAINTRNIVIGSSGSGKTNFLMNYINVMQGTFNKIIIVTKMHEPLYDYFKSRIDDGLLEIIYGLNNFKMKDDDYYGQTLVCFDDMQTESEKAQEKIVELSIRGRKIKGGVTLMYLAQTYFQIPKVLRKQADYIFILKVQTMRDLKMILSEYALNIDRQDLIEMYNICCNTGDITGFMTIDLKSKQDSGLTYRYQFTTPLSVEEE